MHDIKRGKQTIAGCLRGDGFDNLENCDFSFQDYQELIKARFDCDDSERLCSFFQGMSRLSNNAKEIIRLVLNPPSEFLVLLINRKSNRPKTLTQNTIRKYLIQLCGWRIYDVEKSFIEIKKSLEKF